MVETMDPVSKRHFTCTPPIDTVIDGHTPTRCETVSLLTGVCTLEPVISPPALWLCKTEGASFPLADWKGTRSMGDEADGGAGGGEPEKRHAHYHNYW